MCGEELYLPFVDQTFVSDPEATEVLPNYSELERAAGEADSESM